MKIAIVYEPWAHGEAHIEFNKAFLYVLSNIYDEIFFLGEKYHVKRLEENIYSKPVKFTSIKITNYITLKGKLASIPTEIKNIITIKKLNKSSDIYFSYGAAHSMLISEKILKNRKVFYVQHGQIEYLYKKNSFLSLNHYILPALERLPENHKIIILADFIKNNLVKICPKIENKVICIDHPFIKSDKDITFFEQEVETNEIKIGTIGVGTKEKGIELLNEIASNVSKQNENIKFYHIGRLYNNVNIDYSVVNVPLRTESLIPRNEFLLEISKLDFILFLYPKDSYRLTASGAIFDAFLVGKPILALENDYFSYLFKKAGNVGFLCNDKDQLISTIKKLPILTKEEYKNLINNSKAALNSFSPKVVADELCKQMGDM